MDKKNKNIMHYDRRADVLAVWLRKGAEEEFVEVAPNVVVELDKKGSVIGIEILRASRVLRSLLKAGAHKSRSLAYAR